MTYKLNEKMKNQKTYAVDTNQYRIRLDANESFLDPGKLFEKEIAEVISKISLNRYPDDTYLSLRTAFGKLYGIDPEMVMAGNGSDELLAFLIGGFMAKGEKLLTFSPDFSMYSVFAATYDRDCVIITKPESGEVTSDLMIAAVKESGAAAVLFSNPTSPTADVILREEIIKLIRATEALIIVDEAYMDFSDQSVLDLVEKHDNLLVLKTCSKALGCAGIRLGFSVASKEITAAMNTVRPPYNLNSATAEIGRLILSKPEYMKAVVAEIKKYRETVFNELCSLSETGWIQTVHPSNTNYIYLETDHADAIYEELRRRSILIRNFGNALRITIGTKEENEELIAVMRQITADPL